MAKFPYFLAGVFNDYDLERLLKYFKDGLNSLEEERKKREQFKRDQGHDQSKDF